VTKKEYVALTKCFFCGESDKILLATHYNRNGEPLHDLAPMHNKVVDMEPCSQCADYMKQGIILIGIDAEKSAQGWEREKLPNPWRTGAFAVLKEEAILRMVNDKKVIDFAVKCRFMFVEHEAMAMMGVLPEQQEAP